MHAVLITLLAAAVGLGDGLAGKTAARPGGPAPRAAAATAAKGGPSVAFEVREIRVASIDWRGKLMTSLQPVSRQEGTAVWTLNAAGFARLLEVCQADPRTNVLQAPAMVVRVGAPARMTNEEAHKYVGSLKRVADGAPNHSTKLAFEPQMDVAHNGVRVNIVSSQLRGQALLAQVIVEENRLVALHTTGYSETVTPAPGVDPEVAQASFLEKLSPKHGPHPASLRAQIQVPEVDSRRAEGQWLIPAEGAILVSLGPRPSRESGLRKGYEELLITITARPDPAGQTGSAKGVVVSPKPGASGGMERIGIDLKATPTGLAPRMTVKPAGPSLPR